MATKTKGNGKMKATKTERPGVQVVLRVPSETKALLAKTAKDLGLTLPPTFLFQADEVIR